MVLALVEKQQYHTADVTKLKCSSYSVYIRRAATTAVCCTTPYHEVQSTSWIAGAVGHLPTTVPTAWPQKHKRKNTQTYMQTHTRTQKHTCIHTTPGLDAVIEKNRTEDPMPAPPPPLGVVGVEPPPTQQHDENAAIELGRKAAAAAAVASPDA